jgi:hypothetical protein
LADTTKDFAEFGLGEVEPANLPDAAPDRLRVDSNFNILFDYIPCAIVLFSLRVHASTSLLAFCLDFIAQTALAGN